MTNRFTLEYWVDDRWYVGQLKEYPQIMTQGETLEELEENIKDAYLLMLEENAVTSPAGLTELRTCRIHSSSF